MYYYVLLQTFYLRFEAAVHFRTCTFLLLSSKGVVKLNISLHAYQLIFNVNIVVVSVNWSSRDFITLRFLQLMAWWWRCSHVAYMRLCSGSSGSCVGRCGEEFTRGQRCTCDFSCQKHNECCADFQSTCITGRTLSGPFQYSLLGPF